MPSSQPRDGTHVSYVSCMAGSSLPLEPPGKPLFKAASPYI